MANIVAAPFNSLLAEATEKHLTGKTLDDSSGFKQPAYVRGGRAAQTSRKLKFHQQCVASEMAGKKFADRGAVRDALSSTASACKSRNPF